MHYSDVARVRILSVIDLIVFNENILSGSIGDGKIGNDLEIGLGIIFLFFFSR